MITCLFQLPRITSGNDSRPRRRRLGITSISVIKKNTFTCHAVKSRRIEPGSSISTHVPCVISNAKQYIGLFVFHMSCHSCLDSSCRTHCIRNKRQRIYIHNRSGFRSIFRVQNYAQTLFLALLSVPNPVFSVPPIVLSVHLTFTNR